MIQIRCEHITAPFTVGVDSREKHPYTFTGIRGDGGAKEKTLLVPTEVRTLETGDYTVIMPDLSAGLTIERKSLRDFISTVVRSRDRFERELDRMNSMMCAHVVVESDWREILERCNEFTQAPAKAIQRSVISWSITFPNVHWWMCSDRFTAERTTFRILQKFWQSQQC